MNMNNLNKNKNLNLVNNGNLGVIKNHNYQRQMSKNEISNSNLNEINKKVPINVTNNSTINKNDRRNSTSTEKNLIANKKPTSNEVWQIDMKEFYENIGLNTKEKEKKPKNNVRRKFFHWYLAISNYKKNVTNFNRNETQNLTKNEFKGPHYVNLNIVLENNSKSEKSEDFLNLFSNK